MFIIGALLSRLHGSTWLPYKILKSILWALPFAVIVWLLLGGWWALLVLAGCSLTKSTGHGNWLDYGRRNNEVFEDERTEFLIKPAKSKLSGYWYDALGMLITGILSTLPFALVMFFVNPIYYVVAVFGGALKTVGYMIGWKFLPKQATVIGELFSGATAYLVLDLIIIMEFVL